MESTDYMSFADYKLAKLNQGTSVTDFLSKPALMLWNELTCDHNSFKLTQMKS